MSLTQEAQQFTWAAHAGYEHTDNCNGWPGCDLDFREWCGVCNYGGKIKPHPEQEVEVVENIEVDEKVRRAQKLTKVQFGVFINVNGSYWCRSLNSTYDVASRVAGTIAKALKKATKIQRVATVGQLEDAEFQIEKLADWESDVF